MDEIDEQIKMEYERHFLQQIVFKVETIPVKTVLKHVKNLSY